MTQVGTRPSSEQDPEPQLSPAPPIIWPDLQELFEGHFETLARALWVVSDEAADAVQEAFGEAHRQWSQVRTYDDPLAWIRRVAINKAVDRTRRTHRQWRLTERLGRSLDPISPAPSTDHLDVQAAIQKLPLRQRLAVVLYYLADLPIDQVAGAMGISGGAVKAALHSARKKLLPLLEVKDDDD
ncbi:MAG: RNA polymerase sigma factor [Acidimicrobiales bacterium]